MLSVRNECCNSGTMSVVPLDIMITSGANDRNQCWLRSYRLLSVDRCETVHYSVECWKFVCRVGQHDSQVCYECVGDKLSTIIKLIIPSSTISTTVILITTISTNNSDLLQCHHLNTLPFCRCCTFQMFSATGSVRFLLNDCRPLPMLLIWPLRATSSSSSLSPLPSRELSSLSSSMTPKYQPPPLPETMSQIITTSNNNDGIIDAIPTSDTIAHQCPLTHRKCPTLSNITEHYLEIVNSNASTPITDKTRPPLSDGFISHTTTVKRRLLICLLTLFTIISTKPVLSDRNRFCK